MFVFSLLDMDYVSILGKHEISESLSNVNLFFVTCPFLYRLYESLAFWETSL
jgi:cyanate lyase